MTNDNAPAANDPARAADDDGVVHVKMARPWPTEIKFVTALTKTPIVFPIPPLTERRE